MSGGGAGEGVEPEREEASRAAASEESFSSASVSSGTVSSGAVPSGAVPSETGRLEIGPSGEPLRRDRSSLRRSNATQRSGGIRRPGRIPVSSWLGSVVWEVLLELVFFGLVVLVSWLVYSELRWTFIAVVFASVNVVLGVVAAVVWIRKRSKRRSAMRRES